MVLFLSCKIIVGCCSGVEKLLILSSIFEEISKTKEQSDKSFPGIESKLSRYNSRIEEIGSYRYALEFNLEYSDFILSLSVFPPNNKK